MHQRDLNLLRNNLQNFSFEIFGLFSLDFSTLALTKNELQKIEFQNLIKG